MQTRKRTFNDREEWLEWRKQGIGASDVPKMLNISRFGDRLDVFLDKTNLGQDKGLSTYMQVKADVAENAARERLLKEKVVTKPLKPVNVESVEYPQLRCSLDGWNDDQVLFEHKLLGVDNWNAINNHYEFPKTYPEQPDELKAIFAQMAYQSLIACPLQMILGITMSTNESFFWLEVHTGMLPSRIVIRNKALKLWNCISSFKKSAQD